MAPCCLWTAYQSSAFPSPCLTDCTPLPFLPPEDSIAMQGDGLQAIVGHVLTLQHTSWKRPLLVLQAVPSCPGQVCQAILHAGLSLEHRLCGSRAGCALWSQGFLSPCV